MINGQLTKQDVVDLIRKSLPQLQTMGVKSIGLFGSFSRDTASVKSDVDLLVDFEPNCKNFDSFMGVSFLLEELLGRKVELVTKDSLSPYIGPHILEEVEYVSKSA